MKLSLKPVDIPFMVGDTVWVNQPCSDTAQQAYFQGRIIQIILEGSFNSTAVVRQRQSIHEIIVSSGVYDLKPLGNDEGSPRVSVEVQFFASQKSLFETEEELVDYQNQTD